MGVRHTQARTVCMKRNGNTRIDIGALEKQGRLQGWLSGSGTHPDEDRPQNKNAARNKAAPQVPPVKRMRKWKGLRRRRRSQEQEHTDTVRNRTESYGTLRNRTEPPGIVRNRPEPYGTVRNRTESYGSREKRCSCPPPDPNATVLHRFVAYCTAPSPCSAQAHPPQCFDVQGVRKKIC
eukprot:gene7386-biopygen1504